MRQFLIDLLKGLEAAVPPPPNCHHAITYAQYGSDTDGWEDRLALQVNKDRRFHCFFLDEDDLADDPQRIITAIAESLAGTAPQNEQLGIGPGQYSQEAKDRK